MSALLLILLGVSALVLVVVVIPAIMERRLREELADLLPRCTTAPSTLTDRAARRAYRRAMRESHRYQREARRSGASHAEHYQRLAVQRLLDAQRILATGAVAAESGEVSLADGARDGSR